MSQIMLVLSVCKRAINSLSRWGAVGGGVAVIYVVMVSAYDVVSRSLFNSPTEWALETSEMAQVFAVFLGLAYTEMTGGHITMELVTEKMPARVRMTMQSVFLVVALVFLGILVWKSSQLSAVYFNRMSASSLRLWLFPSYVIIPLGCFLLLLRTLVRLTDNVNSLREVAGQPLVMAGKVD